MVRRTKEAECGRPISFSRPPRRLRIVVESVEVNPVLNPVRFQMPR